MKLLIALVIALTAFFAFQFATFAVAVRWPAIFDADVACGIVAYDNGGLRECGIRQPLRSVPLVAYAQAHGPTPDYPVCYDCIDPPTLSSVDARVQLFNN